MLERQEETGVNVRDEDDFVESGEKNRVYELDHRALIEHHHGLVSITHWLY
jgi:hypothetical protein